MKKPPLLPTILMVMGVAVLCALGTWQLQRLQWKMDIIHHLDAEYRKEAQLIQPNELEQDFMFRRGVLRGRYLGSNLKIGPRTHEGKNGYHVYAPFRLDNGRVVFVNKGWIAADHKVWPENPVRRRITGVLKMPPARNMFTPENNPGEGQWYHPDIEEMAEALKIGNPAPYIFMMEGGPSAYPVPVAAEVRPNNNHLQYALFWFSLAGSLVVIYGLRFLRN